MVTQQARVGQYSGAVSNTQVFFLASLASSPEESVRFDYIRPKLVASVEYNPTGRLPHKQIMVDIQLDRKNLLEQGLIDRSEDSKRYWRTPSGDQVAMAQLPLIKLHQKMVAIAAKQRMIKDGTYRIDFSVLAGICIFSPSINPSREKPAEFSVTLKKLLEQLKAVGKVSLHNNGVSWKPIAPPAEFERYQKRPGLLIFGDTLEEWDRIFNKLWSTTVYPAKPGKITSDMMKSFVTLSASFCFELKGGPINKGALDLSNAPDEGSELEIDFQRLQLLRQEVREWISRRKESLLDDKPAKSGR